MKYLLLVMISVMGLYARQTEPTKDTYKNCTIKARARNDGRLIKQYACHEGSVELLVELEGEYSDVPDGLVYKNFGAYRGGIYKEFGAYWGGETADFGTISFPFSIYTDCKVGVDLGQYRWSYGSSNTRGYLSETDQFTCGNYIVELQGEWGEEIQGNWQYHTQLGEVNNEASWVDDVERAKSSDFQKWCKTAYGWSLCGWVDVPKVDHGKAPVYKR